MTACATAPPYAVCIGGSEFLLTFLERAVRLSTPRVDIIAPYVDDTAFIDHTFRRAWHRLMAKAPATMIVRTPESAATALRSLPQTAHRHEVLLNRRVHAKLFLARSAEGWLALAGSLNLTGAALKTNQELAVLFSGTAPENIMRRLGDMVDAIRYDSLRFHTSAAQRNGDRPSPAAASAHKPAASARPRNYTDFRRWHD